MPQIVKRYFDSPRAKPLVNLVFLFSAKSKIMSRRDTILQSHSHIAGAGPDLAETRELWNTRLKLKPKKVT
jgi:hypothetical protein